MAIPLPDQYSQAMQQEVTRSRVAAALMTIAITSFSATANADATKQKKRLALASEVLADVEANLTPVSWVVVTRPSLNSVDDLNDVNIVGILNQATFDLIAAQLISDAAVA